MNNLSYYVPLSKGRIFTFVLMVPISMEGDMTYLLIKIIQVYKKLRVENL